MNLDERLQKDLSPDIYCLVHNKIVNLEQQCKKQKEIIDKANKKINNMFDNGDDNKILDDLLELSKILEGKKVSE